MYVSIVIPTYNRCHVLRNLLDSLLEIRNEGDDHEIIVVDNGSNDGTRTVVEQASAAFTMINIRYIHEPVPGLLAGRHRGALEAEGDICAFLDDDVRVDKGWLMALKEVFSNSEVALAGGPSTPLFESNPPDWLGTYYSYDEHGHHCSWLSLIDAGDCIQEIDPLYVWGLNFTIRKNILFDLNGFHPDLVPKSLQRFQGDGETGLSLKLRQQGLKALYHPSAAVEHGIPASRLTVEYFEQRAFYQGVCDSYTQIRLHGKPGSLKGHLYKTKRLILDLCKRRTTAQSRTTIAYMAGYRFHQLEVTRDSELLTWVLCNDYLDDWLPKGWEQYYTGK